MKSLSVLLVIVMTSLVVAQDSSSSSAEPDLSVLKISWRRVEPVKPMLSESRQGRNPKNEDGLKRAIDSAERQTTPTFRVWSGFVYEFIVKNSGAKIIKHIVFEHSFTDPGTQRTVGRRQYRSNVRIRPGATAKIVVRSSRPPMGVVDAKQAPQTSQELSTEQMVIQRIKYADGSVWER